MLVISVGLSIVSLLTFHTHAADPEQFHIALAGSNGMRVSWFTSEDTTDVGCIYGLSENVLNQVTQDVTSITYLANYGTHHHAKFSNLDFATKYYYSCGSLKGTMSDVYSFRTSPLTTPDELAPLKFAVVGDMGYENSTTRPMGILGAVTMAANWSASYSLNTLESWLNNGEMEMLWHVGDVGYADDACWHTIKTATTFVYEDAYNGFMNWISHIARQIPYHVSVGNHEIECHDPACVLRYKDLGLPLSNFTAYNARWAMPGRESKGVKNMWFSWDYGPVHFISIDTSTDFTDAPDQVSGGSHVFKAGNFGSYEGEYMDWVEQDLKQAYENPDVKWIIAGGHRPFGDGINSDELQSLFTKYGVAMYLAGHSHSYSRFAAEDFGGTVNIVVGGAGCEEMTFVESNPNGLHTGTTTCEEWSQRLVKGELKNKKEVCEGAVFFTDAYAIGKLTIANGGYGDILWELYSSVDGSVIDTVTISANTAKK